MLSEFLRLNGGEYLRKTLRPALKFYLKKDTVHYEVRRPPRARPAPPHRSPQIDPKRIDAAENMTKHINNVTGATQCTPTAPSPSPPPPPPRSPGTAR